MAAGTQPAIAKLTPDPLAGEVLLLPTDSFLSRYKVVIMMAPIVFLWGYFLEEAPISICLLITAGTTIYLVYEANKAARAKEERILRHLNRARNYRPNHAQYHQKSGQEPDHRVTKDNALIVIDIEE